MISYLLGAAVMIYAMLTPIHKTRSQVPHLVQPEGNQEITKKVSE